MNESENCLVNLNAKHEETEYKVMGEATNEPWVGLVCKKCGLIISEVPSLSLFLVPKPIKSKYLN